MQLKNPKLNEIIEPNLSDYIFYKIEVNDKITTEFCFREIISNILLLKIAKWTNQYHDEQIKSKNDILNKNANNIKWTDVTIDI